MESIKEITFVIKCFVIGLLFVICFAAHGANSEWDGYHKNVVVEHGHMGDSPEVVALRHHCVMQKPAGAFWPHHAVVNGRYVGKALTDKAMMQIAGKANYGLTVNTFCW